MGAAGYTQTVNHWMSDSDSQWVAYGVSKEIVVLRSGGERKGITGLRWPNTVFKCTGVRRRYLKTMYFWMPKIGMV